MLLMDTRLLNTYRTRETLVRTGSLPLSRCSQPAWGAAPLPGDRWALDEWAWQAAGKDGPLKLTWLGKVSWKRGDQSLFLEDKGTQLGQGKEDFCSIPILRSRTTGGQSRRLVGMGKVKVFSFPTELLKESLFSLSPGSLCR